MSFLDTTLSPGNGAAAKSAGKSSGQTSDASGETMLRLQGVSKTYDNGYLAIPSVDLEIKQGEFVVLVGPSGCGKSTLLRLIAGLEAPSSGSIGVNGADVTAWEPARRNVAMVFQNYALYPHMSVYDNMAFSLKVRKTPKAEIDQAVRETAAALGIEPCLKSKPGRLSGGQRQRVAMGRALVRRPALFLFDEPLSNLDAKLRAQLRLEIKKLHRRFNVTSVYVTHDQAEAMTLADRIVVLNKGRVEQFAPPEAVFDEPATEFVARFMGSPPMNTLEVAQDAQGAWRLSDGTPIDPSPFPQRALAAKRFKIGMRPEYMEPVDQGGIEATIETIETLGSEELAHMRLGRESLALRCMGARLPEGFKIGAKARVWAKPGREPLYFDRETGRRIA